MIRSAPVFHGEEAGFKVRWRHHRVSRPRMVIDANRVNAGGNKTMLGSRSLTPVET